MRMLTSLALNYCIIRGELRGVLLHLELTHMNVDKI